MTENSKKFLRSKIEYRWQCPIQFRYTRGYGSIYIGLQLYPPLVRIQPASISVWLTMLDDVEDDPYN
jgi:hypothetical protein